MIKFFPGDSRGWSLSLGGGHLTDERPAGPVKDRITFMYGKPFDGRSILVGDKDVGLS